MEREGEREGGRERERSLLSPLSLTTQGYSGGKLYDGQYIANTTNTIVVTANYRLGAIGFLVYGSGSDAIEGNFGFRV